MEGGDTSDFLILKLNLIECVMQISKYARLSEKSLAMQDVVFSYLNIVHNQGERALIFFQGCKLFGGIESLEKIPGFRSELRDPIVESDPIPFQIFNLIGSLIESLVETIRSLTVQNLNFI